MTTILCNQQYCDFNKSEKCLKEHITLCNITSVPRHFWFACFTYSGKDPSVREKTIRETFKQIEEIIGDDFLPNSEDPPLTKDRNVIRQIPSINARANEIHLKLLAYLQDESGGFDVWWAGLSGWHQEALENGMIEIIEKCLRDG
ncbi:MAG: hypothetical protein ABIJ12_13725 [bacterium]